LRRFMPTTYRTFVLGSLALAGIFPFAGFWSKDEILATLDYEGYVAVMWIAILGAFVTAFYMARCVALTFHGAYKGHGHPHESPRVMTGPLVALAVPSVVAGLLNIPGVSWPGLRNFTEWLAVRVVPMGDHHAESIDYLLAGIGLLAAVAGIALGWRLFAPDRDTQAERDRYEIPLLYPLLRRGYYIDDVALGVTAGTTGPLARFVDWTNTYVIDGIVNGVGALSLAAGRFVYGGLDQRGVDGFFNGLSAAADSVGGSLRKLQSGRVQHYAASFVTGVLVLVIVFVLIR
jgi:NADH-quinone oxidoreductase subunit L